MKINGISSFNKQNNINFEGKRLDRNAVSQLTRNNKYSLSEPNQRYISVAIENLGKVKGAKNINFLLDTAAKNAYKTNIILQDAPKNNWTAKLLAAAVAAIAITPFISDKIKAKLASLSQPQQLNDIEKEILALREQLLAVVDLEQINNELNSTMKDFEKNLDYFIISSETTLKHKKYVLERLNYFMSDDYQINPQLEGKKSRILAEIVNDMTIDVPGNEIPNIKAVNQRQHGICAAISIVRKKIAYEDKPNYVDSILSELDSSPYLTVYDRNELGTGKKTQVRKVPVDFTTALERGYRVIDASTMHWMQVSHMTGKNDIAYKEYVPFDKKNFDVNADFFQNVKINDENVEKAQTYYHALMMARKELMDFKARNIKIGVRNQNINEKFDENIELMGHTTALIKEKLYSLNPFLSKDDVQKLLSGMMSLEKNSSSDIKKDDKYSYIANEEPIIIKEKIKNYIKDNFSIENIDEKTFESIFDLMNYYKSLDSSTSTVNPKRYPISNAQRLYKVGTAFRYQVLMGLRESQTLKNSMVINNVIDEDSLIIETADKLIERLENNASDSNLIIEQLAPQTIQLGEVDRENTIIYLNAIKQSAEILLTDTLDSIYAALGLGSRKQVLYNTLEKLKYKSLISNKEEIESLALILKSQNNNEDIIDKASKMQERLINGDDSDYIEIFNQLGNKSQMEVLVNGLNSLVQKIQTEADGKTLARFVEINELNLESNPQSLQEQLLMIQEAINNTNELLTGYSSVLRIVDKDGDVLYSADPEEVIIKKMENKGQIPTAKALRELQEHLDKIAKHRSQNEFGKAGKITDKSLLKFSNREKQTLKNIEESINQMYSYVLKQLDAVLKSDSKDALAELKRIIGLNSGDTFVYDISGGLTSSDEVRVLEYMTGRPHYISTDFKDAIEKMKTTPYSGISGMYIAHNFSGGQHCQYVADIKPMEVKIKDKDGNVKKETVEVLLHDNTWGATEKENSWVDSQGLLRTDYKGGYGGSLGFVVDEKFRTGNRVDRILNDMVYSVSGDPTDNKMYKKIKHNNPLATHMEKQYEDFILDGLSPDAIDFADQIYNLMFLPATQNVVYLENNLKNTIEEIKKANPNAKVEDELKNMLTSLKYAGKSWLGTYKDLKKRMFPKFGVGIRTEEDYAKLADDDYLKVVLEKVALKQNYQTYGRESELARVKNVKDLEKFRQSQRARALNSFKYAFSKTTPIAGYLASKMGIIQENDIRKILEKHNVELDEKDLLRIADNFDIPKEAFNGSAKDLIDYLMSSWSEDIDELITNPEANNEIKEYLFKFLESNVYFNKKDIQSKRLEHLVKFIDREFDPADDGELVNVFRNIQDMTLEEFREEILPLVKDEDLGIKNLTGYDILKKIQYFDEDMNTNFVNTVFYDSFVPETNPKEMKFRYVPNRFYRSTAVGLKNQEFNNLYKAISNDISLLTIPKIFNKYKEMNIRYGAYPAYPKVEYLTEDTLMTTFDSANNVISSSVNMIKLLKCQLESYEIASNLENYISKLSPEQALNTYQRKKVVKMIRRISSLNAKDTSLKELHNLGKQLRKIPRNAPLKEYLPIVNTVVNTFEELKKTNSVEYLKETMSKKEKDIEKGIKTFALAATQDRYQNRMYALLRDLKEAYIQNDSDLINQKKNDLYLFFAKAHIMNKPDELLEKYVKSMAEDSKLHEYNYAFKSYLNLALQYSSLIEMQDLMMQAVEMGITPNIKRMFARHTVELKNELPASMSSDKMITLMINKLIINDDTATAEMFIEKFGLGEAYIDFMSKQIDFDGLKEMVKEASEELKKFYSFQDKVNSYIEYSAKQLEENGENYSEILNELQNKIISTGKKGKIDKDYYNIFSKIITELENKITASPEADKLILFNASLNVAKATVANEVQKDLDTVNDVINSNTTVYELLTGIGLKSRNAENKRKKLLAQFDDFIAYKDSLLNLQQEENSDTI